MESESLRISWGPFDSSLKRKTLPEAYSRRCPWLRTGVPMTASAKRCGMHEMVDMR